MKRATVRDLRYNFRKIEELLRDGTEIQITKRKRVVARLMPPAEEKTFKKPDFEARIRKIFGKKKLKVTGAEIVGWGRQE